METDQPMKEDNKLREEAEKLLDPMAKEYFGHSASIFKKEMNEFVINAILDFHKSQMESDAVEFAEWAFRNGWSFNWVHNDWVKEYHNPKKSSDLYQLFLKSKTDKTE